MHLDHVAGRAGVGRHDRRLPPRDAIEQRRLTRVWRPGDRHHKPLAQPFAAMAVGQCATDLRIELARNRDRRRQQIFRHVPLVRKIDARFDQRQRLDQLLAPGVGLLAERAAHLTVGLPPLALCLGHDQVGKPLDGGEVELAVLEGAAGEFARLSRPQAFDTAERGQESRDDGAAAMRL